MKGAVIGPCGSCICPPLMDLGLHGCRLVMLATFGGLDSPESYLPLFYCYRARLLDGKGCHELIFPDWEPSSALMTSGFNGNDPPFFRNADFIFSFVSVCR